ncbi:MAG: RNA polymerase sigma factor [Lachnospiraceae bacterium]|nr:RNA polymerase sigma factor [Lachnospiraceae bacterium]
MTPSQFSRLLTQHGPSLYGFCFYLTGVRPEAEDLYQETCLKAWERRERLRPDDSPRGFLFSLAIGIWKNNCRKQARRQKRLPQQCFSEYEAVQIPDLSSPQPDECLLQKEQTELLRRTILNMDKKWRLLLYLHYEQELPLKEIAQLLHLPTGTVKSRPAFLIPASLSGSGSALRIWSPYRY